MSEERSASLARTAIWVACVAGLLHAASSLYWAFGGRWLLPTVGQWAVEALEESPLEAGLLLGGIGVVKALAALIPLAVAYGRMPGARFWRAVCAIGGVVLILYGGANVVVSGAVLLGLVRPEGGYDRQAMIGHALLWDPLFLVWGLALIAWLRLSAVHNSGRTAA
ncbi:DUF3995 domain-containing protein [Microbacterium sp. EST19A]|uniref:DUF3995 domain-containing protein n=1 Tax=Microbacterium sp. EST19A TaxID=2862681 RepID=UPI001CBBA8D5|nr:DUF3995 domain-containing protein [Microbacterium sp. EST19A]